MYVGPRVIRAFDDWTRRAKHDKLEGSLEVVAGFAGRCESIERGG